MTAPEISILMGTQNAALYIERCLGSLEAQAREQGAEVIVADNSTDGTADLIASRFPWVRLMRGSADAGLPQLLRDAIRASHGKIVAVTDPFIEFPPDWLAKVRQAHAAEYQVIGGAVENGRTQSVLDWACYLADYGAFMLPARRQETTLLPGNHVTYKRALLDEMQAQFDGGFWKVFFHWELEQRGVKFLFDPEMYVYYAKQNRFGAFMDGYFRHGWFFAGRRCETIGLGERLLRVVTLPLLMLVLLYRRMRDAWSKGRHRRELLLASPVMAVFVAGWAAGEGAGYLLGRPPREVYR